MDTHVPASDSSAEAAAVPVPDEVATPSITGARTELFRTRPGAHRSRHPTRAVSGIGRLADALLGARRALWLEARRALRRAVFAGAPSLCFAAADRVAVVRARLGERPDGIIMPEKAVPG